MGYWLLKSTLHDHIAEDVKFAHVLFMHNLKMVAIKGNESGRDLICNTFKTNCFQSNFGFSYNYAIDTITRYKKRNNFSFKEDYDIPMEIQKTFNGEDFLLYDSEVKEADIIVILGTKTNISHLRYNNVWLGDGTFKTAPSGF
ncbi:hypothetical protein DMUE_4579 [Dictyocoela muelleri]|nr:hypothetical protein DMUE_4579 [Dictyocoela muelleri]